MKNGWDLPLLVNSNNRLRVALITAFLAVVTYLTTNHFHLFTPQLLPLLPLDLAVPFVPWTVWIYTSEYILFVAVYFLIKENEQASKFIYSFLGVQFFSVLIFIFFPTTYPRDLFPLPADLDFLTRMNFQILREGDSPASCLPSLHVGSCYAAAFSFFRKDQMKKFAFFFLWASAVAVTTLTTKQHYAVDVLAGFGVACTFHALVNYVIPQHKWNPTLNARASNPSGSKSLQSMGMELP